MLPVVPTAKAHGPDLYLSLPFRDGSHALILVSCKYTGSDPLTDQAAKLEQASAAKVVDALAEDVHALYAGRIFLLSMGYPNTLPALSRHRHECAAGRTFTEVRLDKGAVEGFAQLPMRKSGHPDVDAVAGAVRQNWQAVTWRL
jgi:hypothetical protein